MSDLREEVMIEEVVGEPFLYEIIIDILTVCSIAHFITGFFLYDDRPQRD